MDFGSDNHAGAHPNVLASIVEASSGVAIGYGDDSLTAKAEQLVRECFECDCDVFFVTTGTAANALALSALTPSWGMIYCHEGAHILNDENTAVELYTGGARLVGVGGDSGKPSIDAMTEHMQAATVHGVHNPRPAVISLSNVTESGTVYRPEELVAFRKLADAHGLKLHLDGARFANAVVSAGSSPAEMSWRSGIDVLSFGLTKNGGIAAEAVVCFDRSIGEQFGYRRKRAGHLWSKHRFLAAQWVALLKDDLWLKNAVHANMMAKRLAEGFAEIPSIQMPWPTEANEVFPVLPDLVKGFLREGCVGFYDWPALPNMARFVTHFDTDPSDVERTLDLAAMA